LRQMSQQIVLQQSRLKREVTPRAWQVYLRLEELQSGRLVALTDRLIRRCRRA